MSALTKAARRPSTAPTISLNTWPDSKWLRKQTKQTPRLTHPSEPNSPKEKSPSVRSSSTCSSLPGSHALASTSPVIPGFHSPATNASTGTATSAEPSIMGCFNCQSHSQPCIQHLPFYQYSSGMTPSSVSSVPLLSPQSTAVPMMRGFDSAMDQYLRSVLRPEAFITPPQPQENIESSFWGSNIDPNLSQVNPSVSPR